jgi:hypothetical protein
MQAIINGKRYDTSKAELICHNNYLGGRNYNREGLSSSLFRTKKGNFFIHHEHLWESDADSITPITLSDAHKWFEKLTVSVMTYEEVFGISPEEA